jgi:Antibiotic biosynthesis monooxygenase
MICVIVEISVPRDHMAQFADDAERVYAEIFKTVPGFLYGALATRPEDARAVAVVFFETAEAYHAAEPVIEGVREAIAISPGVTFTMIDYEVIVRGVGDEADRLFSPIGGSGAPGPPA